MKAVKAKRWVAVFFLSALFCLFGSLSISAKGRVDVPTENTAAPVVLQTGTTSADSTGQWIRPALLLAGMAGSVVYLVTAKPRSKQV